MTRLNTRAPLVAAKDGDDLPAQPRDLLAPRGPAGRAHGSSRAHDPAFWSARDGPEYLRRRVYLTGPAAL
jgi:hypothetical protein